MASGRIKLDIDARGLPAGDYEVVVNDIMLGALRLEVDDDRTEGEQEFEVELEGLAPGTYDILIGDAIRGTITLGGAAGNSGPRKFKSGADDEHEIPLDFTVSGAPGGAERSR